MKRSNFTFLFLFALLSFVSINLGAQATSSSCIDKVNISVDAQCGWVVNERVLGATGPAMSASSIVINGQLFPLTATGSGFTTTGSLAGTATSTPFPGINLPWGGLAQYQLFENDNGTGPMLCWGDIQFEIKQTPTVMTRRWDIMCSQPLPRLPRVSSVAAAANGACSAPITNITSNEYTSGDACTGFVRIRKITGTADIDGNKVPVDLRIDSIFESPLDTGMVTCPLGGPGADGNIDFETEAIQLACEFLGGEYPSPDVVFNYFKDDYLRAGRNDDVASSLATPYAYPYIDKGIDFYEDEVCFDDIRDRDTTLTVLGTLDDGTEYWYDVTVRIHDTVEICNDVDIPYQLNLPLPKGVTCNLSVKCTDMQFAGCAGPNSKIMRTWQVLDWCNGSIKECMQWIVVKPLSPGFVTVLGKDVRRSRNRINNPGGFLYMYPNFEVPVPIAPWTCEGQLQLEATTFSSCAPDVDILWTTDFGYIDRNNVLRGLWYGERATVTATAVTDCGSHGDRTDFVFTVIPQNHIYPVPVAEDEVNVSLTADPTGTVSPDGGVAKVFVEAIDAGSHNAGCGEVELCLITQEELNNPILFSNGVQRTIRITDGHRTYDALVYHPSSECRIDGYAFGRPARKGDPGAPNIPYVICKDFVKFCCEDQGENIVALVATNSGGKSAYSWSVVNVEDKSQNYYTCHSGIVIECGEGYDPYDFAPYFQSAACTPADLDYSIVSDVDACGNGGEFIVWTLGGDVICRTYMPYRGESTFNPYEIKWPKHYDGTTYYGDEAVLRECEPWLNADGDRVKDSRGNELSRIVEYTPRFGNDMGAPFDCTEGADTGQPVWCQSACSLVGSSFEPLEVEAADACKKIIRKWTVIDWCTWDPNTDNQDDENDTDYDQFQSVDDEWLDALGNEGAWYTDYRARPEDPTSNYEIVGFSVVATGNLTTLPCAACDKQNAQADHIYFRYKRVDEDGYYTFDQVIKVLDETDPIVDVIEEYAISITDGAQAKGDDFDDCYANGDITASVTDMCGDTDLSADGAAWWIEVWRSNADGDKLGNNPVRTKTAFGTEATMNSQNGTSGDYHLIYWSVRDGCGNVGTAYTHIAFVDDKQPTPVCIQDLSTAIMPTSGTVEIWAADYDNGSFDNCSEVEYWFLLDEDGNPTDDQENGTFSKNLLVTCDMIANYGQGETLVLGLYVSDAQLNIDFCNITLNVNGAAEVCDLASTASIFGEAATSLGDMIESAKVSLNVGAQDLTDVSGKYAFNGTALSSSYEIKAEKNDDYLNGVTTLDLVLIQKHILGLQNLDNAYNVIAADINNSGSISAIDLVELRKLILGIYAELPNNDSWRFIDATQTFDDELAPFPFQEVLRIESLGGDVDNQNFVGVKIGDVSGNAIANSLLAENRSVAGSLNLELRDATASSGELVEVAVSSSNFTDISAYQFTMELSGLEFVGATSGAIEVGADNFGLLDGNTVTTAWFAAEAVTSTEDLFTLTFRATQDVVLSNAFAISSRVTTAAAYTSTLETLDVAVVYNTVGEGGFALLQNTPNPFDEITQIGFELPGAGTATLTVFDVTGKTVSVINGSYSSGFNTITLKKSELGQSGVLYYQLESGDFTATRKMILID